MCRRYLVVGWIMLAFGAGLLIGKWAEGGFLFHCLGIGLLLCGGMILFKK